MDEDKINLRPIVRLCPKRTVLPHSIFQCQQLLSRDLFGYMSSPTIHHLSRAYDFFFGFSNTGIEHIDQVVQRYFHLEQLDALASFQVEIKIVVKLSTKLIDNGCLAHLTSSSQDERLVSFILFPSLQFIDEPPQVCCLAARLRGSLSLACYFVRR